jgi:hypothetical protein
MILACPKCGAKNHIGDTPDSTIVYRCGTCKFLLWHPPDASNTEYWTKYMKDGQVDWNQYQDDQNRETQVRAKSYLQDLKKLSDDELMAFDIKLHEESLEIEKRNDLSYHVADPALYAAMLREVDRRSVAAGWFWIRWLKPKNYKKWVGHCRRTEGISLEVAQEVVSRTHPDITLERK